MSHRIYALWRRTVLRHLCQAFIPNLRGEREYCARFRHVHGTQTHRTESGMQWETAPPGKIQRIIHD